MFSSLLTVSIHKQNKTTYRIPVVLICFYFHSLFLKKGGGVVRFSNLTNVLLPNIFDSVLPCMLDFVLYTKCIVLREYHEPNKESNRIVEHCCCIYVINKLNIKRKPSVRKNS